MTDRVRVTTIVGRNEIERFALVEASRCRAEGASEEERRWLDLLAIIDRAALASQPAPTVTDEAKKAWDDGHRRGYSDGYDDNGNGYQHDPDVEYTPEGNPYRIARMTTEEGE